MENNYVQGPQGPSRRTFISASAATATAITVPLVGQATVASASTDGKPAPIPRRRDFDPGLIALLRQIDPNRIQSTIQTLVGFGTRHTLSSQTDPVRGI